MTNNLTTIAALPSGSGCKSSLPSEVGKVRKIGWPFLVGIDPGSPKGDVSVVVNVTIGDETTMKQVRGAIAASERRMTNGLRRSQGYTGGTC